MKDINLIIPIKSLSIEIYDFDNRQKLIHQTDLDYRISVNNESFLIFNLVNGLSTIEQITEKFNDQYNIETPPRVIYRVLKDQFEKYGLILVDAKTNIRPKQRELHLRLSFLILKERTVNLISTFLSFLFNKKIWLPVILTCFFLLISVLINDFSTITEMLNSSISIHFFILLPLFEIASFFHEFGHATACKRFGAQVGGIGFGFYFFMPVLFSDVSDAWKLPSGKRIIVNIAGLYFEIIIAAISVIIYLITKNEVFLLFPCLLLLDTIHNLNPLLKFDGYWILSDFLKIPNLHRTANKTFVRFIKNQDICVSTKKKWFLIVYEILSKMYIIFVISTIVFFQHSSILAFPVTFYNFITDVFLQKQLDNYKYIDFILPSIFYYLLIKHIIFFIIKSILNKARGKFDFNSDM